MSDVSMSYRYFSRSSNPYSICTSLIQFLSSIPLILCTNVRNIEKPVTFSSTIIMYVKDDQECLNIHL